MKLSPRIFIVALTLLLTACGARGPKNSTTHPATSASSSQPKILYYRAPMNPAATSPVPAKDAMGMSYVPVYANSTGGGIRVSPSVVNNLNIRTALVKQGTLARTIATVGYVESDSTRVTRLHTRADGWVRQLALRSAGERVKQGERLFTLYSPKLVTAEEEYLHALAGKNRDLIRLSRERLASLGVSDAQISEIAHTRKADPDIPYTAERDGFVTALNVRAGQYVTPSMEVLAITNLKRVLVKAAVFETQANWVRVGDTAALTLSALPGEVLKGRVKYVYPTLDPVTRTLGVELAFDNPEAKLRPGMYGRVILAVEPVPQAVYIPQEALIQTGSGDRVVVALPGGLFDVRTVTAGIESGGLVQILSGLTSGERVVVSGEFLLDSEENLRAGLQRLQADPPDKDRKGKAGGVR